MSDVDTGAALGPAIGGWAIAGALVAVALVAVGPSSPAAYTDTRTVVYADPGAATYILVRELLFAVIGAAGIGLGAYVGDRTSPSVSRLRAAGTWAAAFVVAVFAAWYLRPLLLGEPSPMTAFAMTFGLVGGVASTLVSSRGRGVREWVRALLAGTSWAIGARLALVSLYAVGYLAAAAIGLSLAPFGRLGPGRPIASAVAVGLAAAIAGAGCGAAASAIAVTLQRPAARPRSLRSPGLDRT